jgi:hypothetical protein
MKAFAFRVLMIPVTGAAIVALEIIERYRRAVAYRY